MYSTREIQPSDIDLICDHRQRMFVEAGTDKTAIASMMAPFRTWLENHLQRQTYYGFVVEREAAPAASIGLMALDWPPHPEHPLEAQRGYILNLYVEPQHRKKGLAKKLMSLADIEFAKRGISFYILHPTAVAKPIYTSLRWTDSGEMVKSNRLKT